ncbi:MAG: glycosyltransferase family 4 protein [Patescibacteria group bacterium]|nr:glycosyltransferase family 4 protein [Patescibacteria group bacterium]
MKKIGIDARLYQQTGIGVYLQNLLYYLDKRAPDDICFYVYLLKQDKDKIVFKRKNFVKREANFYWHSFSEQIFFTKLLIIDNLDLAHFTYFSYPIFYQKKFMATVHDLTPLLFRTGQSSAKSQLVYFFKHLAYQIVLSSQVKKAKVILTPTFSVKNEIVRIFGKKYLSKTIPIYEGVNYKLKTIKPIKPRFINTDQDDFFIYVGNFYPHKNVQRLIEVFLKNHFSQKLILLGPNDFFSQKLMKKFNLKEKNEKIIFYFNPSLSELVYCYQKALALIHPSFSEGFGLPLLEAAYFNCPIIASNIAVFQEILGKNFISFNPNDNNDIKAKIDFFLKRRPRFNYSLLIKKFSFEKMTQETLKVYQQLLNN